jgi:uncharacterized membrane protein YqjE
MQEKVTPLHAEPQDRSFVGLFRDLTRETTTLVQQEVALAKAEVNEKISQVTSGAASLASGGAVAFAGLLFLLLSAVLALNKVWAPWLSALVVGGVVLIIGLIMLGAGRSKLEAGNLALQRTAHSLKRDKDMVKEKLS